MLVEENIMRQCRYRTEFKEISSEKFAKEFCTVRVNAGRRSGSTFTGTEIALNMFDIPLILCTSHTMQDVIESEISRLVNRYGFTKNNYRVMTIDSNFFGIDCDSIIIDAASIISQDKIDNIYKLFAENTRKKDFCFILLG